VRRVGLLDADEARGEVGDLRERGVEADRPQGLVDAFGERCGQRGLSIVVDHADVIRTVDR
jgi:hypothetical protein